ncbi:hypothetical protein [Agrobacterium vitis]|uniref:hypothetical protein n=1 Tax=Agrobacterium vitis TaxID=373 RepID=UPI0012EAF69F|nr:hypothetical protein [Agrobacterium vitis]MUO86758.1 hypothetical protein [Agrobacterium vitis]
MTDETTRPNTDQDAAAQQLHEKQAKAVANAVFNLWPTFQPQGFSSEAILEGTINGAAAAVMMGSGMNRYQFADVLSGMADIFRAPSDLNRGNFHVVK